MDFGTIFYSEVVFDLVFGGFEAPQELGLSVGGA